MSPKLSHRGGVVLMCAALALAVLTASAPRSQAQVEIAPVTNRFFGAADAAIGQTIRVNVSSSDDPDQFPAAAACTIAIQLLGADGNLLTAPVKQQLGIGQTFFLDLNPNSLRRPGNRVLFRAVVSSIDDPGEAPNPCTDIGATVEVYDNLTGRTQVFIGDPTIRGQTK